MVTVMIADDNAELNNLYCNYLAKDKDIKIICSTSDGESTLQKYKKLKPDVLLLDLNLPKMNGIDVLNNICLDTNEKKKCNIIVVSGDDFLRYNLLNTSKIFKIIPKSKPVKLDDILKTIKELTRSNTEKTLNDKDLKYFLFSLNFNLYSAGTIYLMEAITYGYENPKLLENIKDLYSLISKNHNVSESAVKWGIRNSINTMNNNTTNKEIKSKFDIGYTKKMTPKFFIPLVVSHFQD